MVQIHILGVGLSKTGTTSLCRALQLLGLNTVRYEEHRMRQQVCGGPSSDDYRCFDDVDAAVDLPAAHFWEQLDLAYPDLLFILTLRDPNAWWRSVENHFNVRIPATGRPETEFRMKLRTLVYGSPVATEGPYKAAFSRHNNRILANIPRERLLVMDITAGDGWEPLCAFLGRPLPSASFPWLNRRT